MPLDETTPEPPAVVDARTGIRAYNKRVAAYVGAIFVSTAAMVGVDLLTSNGPAFLAMGALMLVITFAGIPFLKEKEHLNARHTIQTWESRALQDQFDQFDRTAGAEVKTDPRMAAAAGMAERIRALQASDEATDEMVTRLELRLARLVTDEIAATSAVQALEAAGAGGAGTKRLADAASHLEGEIARILTGLSEADARGSFSRRRSFSITASSAMPFSMMSRYFHAS